MQGFFRKKYVSVLNNKRNGFAEKSKGHTYFQTIHMMCTHFQKAELAEWDVDKIG
ncbi:uncharacterized protein METZ01_LOCUS471512 [marine metagenome]|uniref:Uncharacterized protein n=1 Tax=marine metagenome TaxID=408172 RepID=A0A383BGT1_9ZZZZ